MNVRSSVTKIHCDCCNSELQDDGVVKVVGGSFVPKWIRYCKYDICNDCALLMFQDMIKDITISAVAAMCSNIKKNGTHESNMVPC